MKKSEITKLLKEQPKSYLQYKDRNKFDETDLYNLKHGNLLRAVQKNESNLIIPKAREFSVDSDFYLEISKEGVVPPFTSRRQIADFYGITYPTVQHLILKGRSPKHKLICKKLSEIEHL